MKSNKLDFLFDLFRDYLMQEGVILESGTIVDTSFVEAPKQRNEIIETRINRLSITKFLKNGLRTSCAKRILMPVGLQRVAKGIMETRIT